jgi:DNA-binding MarR family transcriptional regulator
MAKKSIPAPDVETASRAHQIRGLCAVVTKIARADLQRMLDSRDAGISAIEHGVLRHLSNGVNSMAAISRLMGVSPSTLVYVVDRLVGKGLARRGKDTKDRRREPLVLEKKGADLFAQVPKLDQESLLMKSLRQMPESEQHQLVQLLSSFVSGLAGNEHLQSGDRSGA